MNAASSTAERTNPPTVSADPHPCRGASMTVNTSRTIAAMESTRPSGSSRPASGSRVRGISRQPRTSDAVTIGRFTRKIEPHQKCSSSQPPLTGPSATARPETAAQMPMALARSVGSTNTLVRIARVAGKTMAAPTPIAALAAMSSPAVVQKAATVEVAANSTRPDCSIPFRPNRSPRLPKASSSAANTRL